MNQHDSARETRKTELRAPGGDDAVPSRSEDLAVMDAGDQPSGVRGATVTGEKRYTGDGRVVKDEPLGGAHLDGLGRDGTSGTRGVLGVNSGGNANTYGTTANQGNSAIGPNANTYGAQAVPNTGTFGPNARNNTNNSTLVGAGLAAGGVAGVAGAAALHSKGNGNEVRTGGSGTADSSRYVTPSEGPGPGAYPFGAQAQRDAGAGATRSTNANRAGFVARDDVPPNDGSEPRTSSSRDFAEREVVSSGRDGLSATREAHTDASGTYTSRQVLSDGTTGASAINATYVGSDGLGERERFVTRDGVTEHDTMLGADGLSGTRDIRTDAAKGTYASRGVLSDSTTGASVANATYVGPQGLSEREVYASREGVRAHEELATSQGVAQRDLRASSDGGVVERDTLSTERGYAERDVRAGPDGYAQQREVLSGPQGTVERNVVVGPDGNVVAAQAYSDEHHAPAPAQTNANAKSNAGLAAGVGGAAVGAATLGASALGKSGGGGGGLGAASSLLGGSSDKSSSPLGTGALGAAALTSGSGGALGGAAKQLYVEHETKKVLDSTGVSGVIGPQGQKAVSRGVGKAVVGSGAGDKLGAAALGGAVGGGGGALGGLGAASALSGSGSGGGTNSLSALSSVFGAAGDKADRDKAKTGRQAYSQVDAGSAARGGQTHGNNASLGAGAGACGNNNASLGQRAPGACTPTNRSNAYFSQNMPGGLGTHTPPAMA